MYEIVEIFDNENNIELQEVLNSCILSYYEKRFLYNK